MSKFTLNIEEDYDFSLIGISCHAKDYRLCYELNKILEIDLVRGEDLDIDSKNTKANYALYDYIDEENFIDYYLISNRSNKGFLIPEHKSTDFFLLLKGASNDDIIENIINKISEIQLVLTSFQIDVNSLKSKQNLIF
ncbi:MAG: IPExxxVDY family protein [Flavobacteriales bacterium]|nr:IPExxxVDY family protein [Flavobacteriales bacterium]